MFLALLESLQQVRFNRVYFTISRAKVWKILNFLVDFVTENSNKLQKLGLEGEKKKKTVQPSINQSMCSHLGKTYKLQ
jgi:hypothetical protein